MRVAYLIPDLLNCGPVNVVINLIKELELLGVQTRLIAIRSFTDFNLLIKLKNICSLGVYSLDEDDIYKLCENIDVIHSHGFYPDKILYKLDIKNIKKISTVHCMFYQDYLNEYGFLKGLVGAYLHFKYLKNGRFDAILGCSNAVKSYVYEKINTFNIYGVNNGVDQKIFKSIKFNEKLERRRKLNIADYKKIFVYSGRLIRRKRVPELINIFQDAYSEDNLLIILGDGDEFEICRKKSYNNILFLGSVNNPEYYYQISDFVISNSSAEGYPMSIIEAVSCGCKALLSNIPPHNEFIANNPNLAFLIDDFPILEIVEDNDVKKLSSEIMTMSYLKYYKR